MQQEDSPSPTALYSLVRELTHLVGVASHQNLSQCDSRNTTRIHEACMHALLHHSAHASWELSSPIFLYASLLMRMLMTDPRRYQRLLEQDPFP